MIFPKSNQKAQDWLTQQWNILLGKKIQPNDLHWLISPFGKTNIIADDFITELAEKEGLIIDKKNENVGLLNSIKDLKLTEKESTFLSQSIIDFYEKTSNYNLLILVKWNPFFQVFGKLLNIFFSQKTLFCSDLYAGFACLSYFEMERSKVMIKEKPGKNAGLLTAYSPKTRAKIVSTCLRW